MCSFRDQITGVLAAEVAASGRFQTDIARAVGITAKHLNRIVNGRDHASPEIIDRLLTELGRRPVFATAPRSEEPAP
jgi:plasmid maintenance system antidote protein VapI